MILTLLFKIADPIYVESNHTVSNHSPVTEIRIDPTGPVARPVKQLVVLMPKRLTSYRSLSAAYDILCCLPYTSKNFSFRTLYIAEEATHISKEGCSMRVNSLQISCSIRGMQTVAAPACSDVIPFQEIFPA